MKQRMNMKTLTILSAVVTLSTGCSIITGKGANYANNVKTYGSPDEDPGAATVGTRNFLQIKSSFDRATAVVPDATINAAYNASVTRLSLDGAGLSVSASSLLAMTTLAGEYCKKSVANERAGGTKVLFNAVNFAQGPAALTETVKNAVIDRVAGRFWGRLPTATERQELLTLMNTTQTGVAVAFQNDQGTNTTLNANQQVDAILLVGCAAAGGSLDFVRS